MRIPYDPDEYESVVESRPCTVCNGNPGKCNGGCNGMASFTQRKRSPEDIAKIRADRQREHESAVLIEADAIRARRASELPRKKT